MTQKFELGTAARNAACNAIVDLIDAGSGVGRIEIRSGTQPANVGDASSGNLLGTLTFNSTPAFGDAATGTAIANTIDNDSSANTTGSAGYFRIYAGAAADTAAICQGTAGESGDTPDLVFDSKSIIQGGAIAISSLSISVPIT